MKQPHKVVSILIRRNTFKMADGCREEASAQKTQNWGSYEAKVPVEIWADEEIQQELSAMGRKQNIWENVATKLMTTEYLVAKKAQTPSAL